MQSVCTFPGANLIRRKRRPPRPAQAASVNAEFEAVDTIKVWECEGCGRIDHPQPCIGVCRDRKAELVHASDYRRALERIAELEAVLARFTHEIPA